MPQEPDHLCVFSSLFSWIDCVSFVRLASAILAVQDVVLLSLVNLLLRQALPEASMGRGVDGSRGRKWKERRGDETGQYVK